MAEGITPKELDIELHDRVPDGQWEIVDVAFPATAHADFQIPHTLSPENAEQVEYTVLRQSTPGTVYEDRSATRTKWSPGFIILRSDTGGWTGRLLLRVLKRSLIWFPGQNAVYTPPVVGILGLDDGGTGADLSGTGPGYLKQAALGSVVSVAASIPAGDIGSGQLALARGGTNADLSATGGTSKFLKQASAGAAVTVVQPAIADLSDAASVVVTGGSYADPAWLTSLAGSKITGQAPVMIVASPAAVTGTSTTAEQDLQTITLPAGTLAADGWGLRISTAVLLAANGNGKRTRVFFGGTAISDTGGIGNSGVYIYNDIWLFRISSTSQLAFGYLNIPGGSSFYTVSAAPAETMANAITIKTTGGWSGNQAYATDCTSKILGVTLFRP